MVSLSQSRILVSVWFNMEVTCVFVVWPHMHSKLELPLVIAGIQVREDKQQLLHLICRSHHCEPLSLWGNLNSRKGSSLHVSQHVIDAHLF